VLARSVIFVKSFLKLQNAEKKYVRDEIEKRAETSWKVAGSITDGVIGIFH
jgi:hypothetical protein